MQQDRGQNELIAQVVNEGLCTGCGACVALCPYLVAWRDRIVRLHPCDLKEGRCYAFCPRTGMEITALRRLLFDEEDMTDELGPVKGYYLARAADERKRKMAQHGGTATALMSLALKEGIIEAAVISEGAERFQQLGVTVAEVSEIEKRGKSKFIVSPVVAEFNRSAKGTARRVGVVATPCQAQALAKMQFAPTTEANPVRKPAFVVGLFCGWTLLWQDFVTLLKSKTPLESISGMDIPPKKEQLEVYTKEGKIDIEMAELRPLIRPACSYCFDTTAEFSDISVGSARMAEDWAETKTWNQVIVRSARGEELLKLARERGILELRSAPESMLAELKAAARKKKEGALQNLIKKSGSAEELIYLNRNDPAVCSIMG